MMKLIFSILLLAFAAPLWASDRLSDAEILAELDDATASEVRWILAERTYWVAHPRFWVARSLCAHQRLLEFTPPNVFKLLARSTSDVACIYGIEGLVTSDVEALKEFLPELVSRREMVQKGYQRGTGTTSPAARAVAETIFEAQLTDKALLKRAWFAWLSAVSEQGARDDDRHIVGWFKTALEELPRADGKLTEQALEYVEMLGDQDDGMDRLRTAMLDDTKPLLKRLSMEALAMAAWTDDREAELLQKIWKRELSAPEDIRDFEIAAAWWDWIVIHTRFDPAPYFNSAGHSGQAKYFDCGWQELDAADWEWLTTHDNPLVKAAVDRLRSNPIAGFRLDRAPPEDAKLLELWMKCTLRQAQGQSAARTLRERLALLQQIREHPSEFRHREYWGHTSADLSLAATLFAVAPIESILELAKELAEREDTDARITAAWMITVALEVAAGKELLHEWDGLKPFVMKLLEAMKNQTGPTVWQDRATVLTLCNATVDAWEDVARLRRSLERDWKLSIARAIADHPRQVPLSDADWFTLHDTFETLEDRAGVFCLAVVKGQQYFLPDDEVSEDVIASTKLVSPTELFRRMREAAAKLDSKRDD